MKRLFRETNMTWKLVIILAVISAIFSAAMLTIPATKDTSLAYIGIYPDAWFVLAILIIMNCKSAKEAAIKTFVFFLISQPLIYLLQVPFSYLGWRIFMYYPRWFVATILTLPGAAVAYLVKKQNWLSVAILSVATGYLSLASANYTRRCLRNFPSGIVGAIFCMASAIVLALALFDKKKHKIAAIVIIALAYAAAFVSGVSF